MRIDADALWHEFERSSEAWEHLRCAEAIKATGERYKVVDVRGSGHFHPRFVLEVSGVEVEYGAKALGLETFAAVEMEADALAKMRAAKDAEERRTRNKAEERDRRIAERTRKLAYERDIQTNGLPALVRRRQITRLTHFTQLRSLASILKFGIYPSTRLYQLPSKPSPNDPIRADHRPDAVCFSITHPNELLFERWRRQTGEPWVVIGVGPELVWDRDCELFYRNAARGAGYAPVPLATPRRPSALEFDRLFAEPSTGLTRQEMGHRECDATDPQAEVLVYGVIERSALKAVYVETPTIHDAALRLLQLEGLRSQLPIVVDRTLYLRRLSTARYKACGERRLEDEENDVYRAAGLPVP